VVSKSGLAADEGYLELGCFWRGLDLGLVLGLGLGLVVSTTTSLMFWTVFLQLELGWYTSWYALDLHCNDLTHPLAITWTRRTSNNISDSYLIQLLTNGVSSSSSWNQSEEKWNRHGAIINGFYFPTWNLASALLNFFQLPTCPRKTTNSINSQNKKRESIPVHAR